MNPAGAASCDRPDSSRDGREIVDALTERISASIYEDGFAAMSSTRVAGRPVLRLCTINPRTQVEDVRALVERLDAIRHRCIG